MTPENKITILERRLDITNRYWMRAAKKALQGDTRELANRVALYEAEPVELALSTLKPEGEQMTPTKEQVNAAYNEGKRRGMTGLPSDFRAVLTASLSSEGEQISDDAVEPILSNNGFDHSVRCCCHECQEDDGTQLRSAAQGVIDWADFALSNSQEFDSHGVKNLDGPAFDKLRSVLSSSEQISGDAREAFLNMIADGELEANPDEGGCFFTINTDESHLTELCATLGITTKHEEVLEDAIARAIDEPDSPTTELSGEAVERGWQDISTAPRDGADILAYGKTEHDQFINSAFYSTSFDIWVWGHVVDPTHWMPLPTPPEQKP